MAAANQQVIADKLGISKATVSRCFTNHAGISATTRAKVFQLAAGMGYIHSENRSAGARRNQKLPTFSVLICSDPEEYFRGDYESPGEQILAGISEYTLLHDITMDVHFIPPQIQSTKDPAFQKIRELKTRAARGVLLIYPFPVDFVKELATRFPLVSLVEQSDQSTIDCVDVDHYDGISAVIDHLIANGHRRIGFYTKDYATEASWSFRRYSAFVEKMARLGMAIRKNDLIGMFPRRFKTVPEGIAAALGQTEDGVTAWVCAADHQAYDLVAEFTKAGLRIPCDVSVTGFDGIHRKGTLPVLTTIEIPFRAIGMTGAERLASRIRKRFGGEQHVLISGKLRPGKTVAAPGS